MKLGQNVTLKVDVFPGSTWDGTITTINPEVDSSTRNVRMRATVENQDGRLKPGMFANVEVVADQLEHVLVVPATSDHLRALRRLGVRGGEDERGGRQGRVGRPTALRPARRTAG